VASRKPGECMTPRVSFNLNLRNVMNELLRLESEKKEILQEISLMQSEKMEIDMQLQRAKQRVYVERIYSDPEWFSKASYASKARGVAMIRAQNKVSLISKRIKEINKQRADENAKVSANTKEAKDVKHKTLMKAFYDNAKLLLNEVAFEKVLRAALDEVHGDLK